MEESSLENKIADMLDVYGYEAPYRVVAELAALVRSECLLFLERVKNEEQINSTLG